MFRVAACILQHHNLWLVLLAAGICVAACAGVFFLLEPNLAARQHGRWRIFAATLAGGGTWATHFVAMLGFDPGLPIGFDLPLTLLSAATCIVGAWGAFAIFDRYTSLRGRVCAGTLLGGAIGAMHYIGMASIHIAAQKVWAPDLVADSLFLSAAFSIATLHAFATAPAKVRVAAAATFLVTAIVSLHFTGMGALMFVPDPSLAGPSHDLDGPLLGVTIATVISAALLVGVILTFADRRIAATELVSAKRVASMALHDALTGLPNRRHLQIALDEILETRNNRGVAIIALDLDRFKPVNDLYGHTVGDELLVRVATLLSEEASKDGFVARVGGDEFILVLKYELADELMGRVSTLVAKFDLPIVLADHEVTVGATLGIALAPDDGEDAALLMRRADSALHRGRDGGRGRFAFFEPGMDARALERAALEQDLRIAVRDDHIIPYFQPLVQLESGKVSGYEILARWPHATRGLINPDQFIQIAAETGLIAELTFNLLRRACRMARNWPGAPRLSLNIAPAQLHDAALPQKLLKILGQCGFPPGRLEIEVTEDALVCDFDAARRLLTSLKNLGVSISLDDFGTGYSSLRHLRELPFDVLKIDRSFVQAMTGSDESLAIVKTIVQLAKSLRLSVIAEGVETEAQVCQLRILGCEQGQGFLLGRPATGAAAHGVETALEPLGPQTASAA